MKLNRSFPVAVCPVARVAADGADKNSSCSLYRDFQRQNPLGIHPGKCPRDYGDPAPGSDIEVAGWGAGVTLFLKGSEEEKNITGLEGPHVHFLACEFSLANRKLTKADVLPGVDTGIEAITKQEHGWTYIKN